jgi:hypothetical protein
MREWLGCADYSTVSVRATALCCYSERKARRLGLLAACQRLSCLFDTNFPTLADGSRSPGTQIRGQGSAAHRQLGRRQTGLPAPSPATMRPSDTARPHPKGFHENCNSGVWVRFLQNSIRVRSRVPPNDRGPRTALRRDNEGAPGPRSLDVPNRSGESAPKPPEPERPGQAFDQGAVLLRRPPAGISLK